MNRLSRLTLSFFLFLAYLFVYSTICVYFMTVSICPKKSRVPSIELYYDAKIYQKKDRDYLLFSIIIYSSCIFYIYVYI